jgi:hypothetical protein
MKYAFIQHNKRVWPISVLCRVLLVSVSGLHSSFRNRPRLILGRLKIKLNVFIAITWTRCCSRARMRRQPPLTMRQSSHYFLPFLRIATACNVIIERQEWI